MTIIQLARTAAALCAVLVLAACAPTPTPSAAPSEDATPVCDASLFSDNVDAELTAEASAMDGDVFPISDLVEAGIPMTCTAHLVVDYTEADQTVAFDIALTDTPIADLTDALDELIGTDGWERDADAPIWREVGEPTHYVQALEIEEGVLIGTTQNG